MTDAERARFDALFHDELAALPAFIHEFIGETPVIIEDHPSPELLCELGMEDDEAADLCGLHSGVPLTERSVSDDPDLESVHLFREGIVSAAGGWDDEREVRAQIRITLLHEIGHHFGLDEDDLEELGYG